MTVPMSEEELRRYFPYSGETVRNFCLNQEDIERRAAFNEWLESRGEPIWRKPSHRI